MILLLGCAPTELEPEPTIDGVAILETNCAETCHNGPGWQMDLVTFGVMDGVADVVSIQAPRYDLVEPGEPEESYLMHKVWGTQTTVGGMGTDMPQVGGLDGEVVDQLEAWITQLNPITGR